MSIARDSRESIDPKAKTPKRKSRTGRRLLLAAGGVVFLVPLAAWGAIHFIPGAGPALADAGRALFGTEFVARAEDLAYTVEDKAKQILQANAPPKEFWSPPPRADSAQEASPSGAPGAFRPADFEPPVASVGAPADGRWIVAMDGAPGEPPLMFKTTVHPDPKRSYAAVAVVAMDLSRLELKPVVGTAEPESADFPASHRPGVVPREELPYLVAAFNGGFKAIHGHYGMMVNSEVVLPPRPEACTLALYSAGAIRIGTWTTLADSEREMKSFRQTPPCLVERGSISSALDDEGARAWGASVSGGTVIRRSAFGVDRTGTIGFYGVGDSVSAQSLARAMQAAGAHDVAELDVNQWFPRFVFYSNAGGENAPKATSTLIPGMRSSPEVYVGAHEDRDFFYVVRRAHKQS